MVIKIEDVRNYWNARPCNIRHSNAEIGSREYFDQVEARKYMVEPHIPAFAEFDKWKGSVFSKLVVDLELMQLTLQGLALYILVLSCLKKVLI